MFGILFISLVCLVLGGSPESPESPECPLTIERPFLIDVYNVSSTVSLRFACTRVYSELVNAGNQSEEVCFSLQLPSDAFISGLCLEVSGRKYAGVVREKEEARRTHEENKETGIPSGLIESRGMDKFRVCLSAGPGERARFSVEYQQLLVRRLGRVRHTVSIQPTQPVPHCWCSVLLVDDLVEGSVSASHGDVERVAEGTRVTYAPSLEEQKREDCRRGVSLDLQTSFLPPEVSEGVGEGLVSEHHFLQYFSPSAGLECLCQTFLFVIDKSGSMSGSKISQAKQAATHLLDSLKAGDRFNVIAFDAEVRSFQPQPVLVGEYREQAREFVESIQAQGETDINSAALEALRQLCGLENSCVSTVTLLSDGEPTYGETDSLSIATNLKNACPGTPISFNCLSFGAGADQALMETLAYGNGGRAQFVYEGQDAAEQLVDFLSAVLCPLLSGVEFVFPEGSVRNVSVLSFPLYYRGDELLVSGERVGTGAISYHVLAHSQKGRYEFRGDISVAEARPEDTECLEGQLHAFLIIRQSLERVKGSQDEKERTELRKKMLAYALQFRFVTELTSLIVSPLTDPDCECPAPCSCTARACVPTDPTAATPEGIKINPEEAIDSHGGISGRISQTMINCATNSVPCLLCICILVSLAMAYYTMV